MVLQADTLVCNALGVKRSSSTVPFKKLVKNCNRPAQHLPDLNMTAITQCFRPKCPCYNFLFMSNHEIETRALPSLSIEEQMCVGY